MTPNNDSILNDVDEELKEGVRTALRKHPELLREKLREIGAIEGGVSVAQEELELTPAEEAVLPVVKQLQNPKSTADFQTIIKEEEPDELANYDSATHREWLSTQLNKLARKGLIGKYREGRSVRYTAEPIDAVRRWALHNNVFEEELDMGHVDEIVADTGMDRQAVLGAVRSLTDS